MCLIYRDGNGNMNLKRGDTDINARKAWGQMILLTFNWATR